MVAQGAAHYAVFFRVPDVTILAVKVATVSFFMVKVLCPDNLVGTVVTVLYLRESQEVLKTHNFTPDLFASPNEGIVQRLEWLKSDSVCRSRS